MDAWRGSEYASVAGLNNFHRFRSFAIALRRGYTVKYFFVIDSMNYEFRDSFIAQTTDKCSWYTFCSLSWNIKILKIDFQNFLVRKRLFHWICDHTWLILLLTITSAKIKRKMQLKLLVTTSNKWFIVLHSKKLKDRLEYYFSELLIKVLRFKHQLRKYIIDSTCIHTIF